MSITTDTAPTPPRRRRRSRLRLALLLLVPLALAALILGPRPPVADAGPPDARAAALTRDLAERLRGLLASNAATAEITVTAAELDAALAAAQRLQPGMVASADIGAEALALDIAAGAPLLPRGLGIGLHMVLAPSEDGLRITSLRLGGLPLPPAAGILALRLGLDRFLGPGLGAYLLDGIETLRLSPGQVTVALAFEGDARLTFYERLRERIRLAAAGPTDTGRVHHFLWWFDRAGEDGDLPETGSALPYLRQVIAKADETLKHAPPDEAKASIFAFTLYCGDDGFGPVIGVGVRPHMLGEGNRCDGTTLDGRVDLRRHFAVSAGLYAASTEQAALGMGELKELLDSNAGGSGFSFDDLAADLAGARFARAFLETPRADWPALLARITGEADVLPDLDGLPEGMNAAEFARRYGDVDSPEYRALLAEITARIDALPLYRAPLSN
ncbi:MAG TPA: hypothetical protein PKA33_17990 [Amaricoccus sp.]|uniref:hypothetical protein n=1 Tax=Amaricoccus sp. TaxID=1872485 RepID=UPI002BF210CC|nr:hypothetical protein [Amaricoccus sp.]HMQ93230.1 hypothetical protein [Amaricoccus sp.]HMR54257.1 hypothetical protein [Amaricoccus sp.]HMR61632.1 hypothetical protein [Amaricoccus sp.]HMU01239.1 hypothetical protein [Amaricoccus sp.]